MILTQLIVHNHLLYVLISMLYFWVLVYIGVGILTYFPFATDNE